jgi:hypothetical protein
MQTTRFTSSPLLAASTLAADDAIPEYDCATGLWQHALETASR